MENMRPMESYLRDILPNNPESVLDIGANHLEIFNFKEWEKRDIKKKTYVDICSVNKDIPDTWKKVECNNIYLPFNEEYDVVQCCNVIEHIPSENWDKFVGELCRVSKDLIYITVNCHETCSHAGDTDLPNRKFFEDRGFHILFQSRYSIIVFKRKIPSWDKRFYDMESYIRSIVMLENIESVLDVGTGHKGVVSQNYYQDEVFIKKGYVCDIWVLKELPPIWKPLKMNALDLLNVLEEKSIDIVQAFGFLEHLEKSDGYKFLDIAEKIVRKAIVISAASYVHGMSPDEKALKDGNPYHRYNSIWHWKDFEKLGYISNYEHMRNGLSFSEEVIAWKILEI